MILNRKPGSQESDSEQWRRLAHSAEFKPIRLARLLGVSLRTLQRHFRLHYSVTVHAWLNTVRLEEAYRRILAGERVKEIALDLGYKHLSHFSAQFKRTYGVPPRLLSPRKTVPQPEAARLILSA